MTKAMKKIKCRICDKKFVQSKLKRHVQTVHEGIKHHQCQFCDKKFGQPEDLKKHVETAHEGIKHHHRRRTKVETTGAT